jgi:molybdopterin converting factor small subunit
MIPPGGIIWIHSLAMRVTVCFHSYFKDLAGCAQTTETLPDGSSLDILLQRLFARFPKLSGLQKSTLVAVGLDYQPRSYLLKEGDEVSLFPPVQGG